MMTTPPRGGLVERLAEAYRHRGRPYADLVIAGRHLDMTPREIAAAQAMVLAEWRAELVLLTAHRNQLEAEPDPVDARLRALLDLDDDELAELHRAGLLRDLGLG